MFKDSAADRCGKILVGDELVSVNGERVVGKTPTTLRSIIMGRVLAFVFPLVLF